MLLVVALGLVAVVALPLLLPHPKPPPEAYKSPGPPKLAITSYVLRELCSAPLLIGTKNNYLYTWVDE